MSATGRAPGWLASAPGCRREVRCCPAVHSSHASAPKHVEAASARDRSGPVSPLVFPGPSRKLSSKRNEEGMKARVVLQMEHSGSLCRSLWKLRGRTSKEGTRFRWTGNLWSNNLATMNEETTRFSLHFPSLQFIFGGEDSSVPGTSFC